MPSASLRYSFVAFYVVLGAALLYGSVTTALHAGGLHGGVPAGHLVLAIALVEGIGAALLLWPRTLRLGGGLLLLALLAAIVSHALRGQLRADLLVYFAGTLFVMVHGPITPIAAPDEQAESY